MASKKNGVGVLLRAELKSKPMSYAALGRACGTSRGMIHNVMTGRRALTPTLADKIAGAFRMSADKRRELHVTGARALGWKV